MIDAALVARKALLITRDLADLADPLGVSDVEFGRLIAAFAGLRNRIVHEYDEVDPRKVYEALATAIEDVSAHLRAVEDYVRWTSSG